MGSWGTGLYSGDFAMDLRGTIGSVLRLPFDSEALLEAVRSTEVQSADNPDDPDHTNFWLIVADQFAKRGIDCPEARERAIAIIDAGADLAAKKTLGLDDKSLAIRAKNLGALRERLTLPVTPAKSRTTLKKPQPLIYAVGDIYIYPICRGEPRNPYNVNPEWEWVKRWQQDGWGAMVVVERGLFLDYLAWYRPLVVGKGFSEPPSVELLIQPSCWFVGLPGTLIKSREKQLKMQRIGQVAIDHDRFIDRFPKRVSPRAAAVSDITISRGMDVRNQAAHDEHRMKRGYPPTPRIESLSEIMA